MKLRAEGDREMKLMLQWVTEPRDVAEVAVGRVTRAGPCFD
jgi:hypothetical protein